MISGPISLTVEAEAYSLAKINQDNRSGVFKDWSADGTRKLTFSVKHTDPTPTSAVESHLVRGDLETYDSAGILLRTTSVWFVLKTSGTAQDTAEVKSLYDGMVAALEANTDAIMDAVLNGEP